MLIILCILKAGTRKCLLFSSLIGLGFEFRKLDAEGVDAVFALSPDFPFVILDDLFGNRQPEPVTVIHAAGFVQPVKTAENILQILFADFFSWKDALPRMAWHGSLFRTHFV